MTLSTNSNREINLIIQLANGLATALEINGSRVELLELWAEELVALREAHDLLLSAGLQPPAAVVNVLRMAGE
ncbi:hypothetical protein ABI_25070 [Asticcacaulis biprosthecium C19]|uniref:Uncharacterized protein n=1 Tax=Asticcacaulis biprosthecium C19 TaxID=715226 RepID=F4QP36_9CAUL|nr:hypothetical protein [Asticcacaulis biprosthecium]EGF91094.1 hypothetical protein ABI_25070 [Asticcacaulis biprosthecium C19]